MSKHLQVLRNVGLVTVRRDGRRTHVSNQRRNASHDSRLVPDVRAALARTAPAHQGTRGGETMTTTAPVSETQTFTHHRRNRRARVARADVRSRSSRRWAGSTKHRRARRCRWSWSRIPAAAGIATWAATTGTCGVSCRASSGRRCWRSGGRCSCRRPRPRTCSTG